MRFLRTNTAVIITVGPFYDKTDGVTIETGLTITNERITLTADTDAGSAPTNILDNVTGATSGTANDLNYITGNDAGMMQLELAAADVNRVGRMFLSITDAANHIPVFHEFMVMPALVYDTYFAASGGATFPAATLASTTNITAGTITTATNVTTVNGLASGVITATAIAADAIGASELAADAVTEIANAVWDTDATSRQTAGTFGQAIGDPAANTTTLYQSIVTDAAGTHVAADIIAIKAETASILTDTAEIGAAGAGLTNINLPDQTMNITGDITGNLSGSVGSVTGLTTATIADAVLDEDMTAHQTQGSLGQAIGDPVADTNTIYKAVVTDATGATVGVDVVAVKSDTAAILVDTGTTLDGRIPAALVGGRIDANIGAVNTDTTAATNLEHMFDGTGYVGGTTKLDVNAAQVSASATAADNLQLFFDGTGYAAATSTIGTVTTLTGKTGFSLDTAEHTNIADAHLKRDMSVVTGEADRSPLNALRFLRNKWSLSGTALTVTKENDSTTAWTSVVTATPGADPITGNDPA